VTGLVGALGLLTRLPVVSRTIAGRDASIAWFPLVGLLLGLAAALAYAVASVVLPPVLAATIAIGCLILLTGALHEDGLADAADAWGGGTTREETLRILRDPGVGTYGALAIGFSLLVRVAALAVLTPSVALLGLPAFHAVSRAATVALLATTPAARTDGLGADARRSATRARAAVAVVLATAASLALIGLLAVAAMAVALVVTVAVRLVAMRRIGGITGDVLGATEQLVEIGAMVLLAGVAYRGGVVP
jgi:adenosylcobinamide-GDP ribazoletransferase